jgi:hypothetical protein
MEKLTFVKGEKVKKTYSKFKEELLDQGWKIQGEEKKAAKKVVVEEDEEEGEEKEVDLDTLDLKGAKALAREAGVDLKGAKSLKDIKEVLKAALAQ